MRRILSILSDIRREQLSEHGAGQGRLSEAADLFHYMDQQMSGITPTSTNERLAETLISADFTYAIMEYVNRLMIPGYERKMFNFEPLVFDDTLSNFLPHTRYQNRQGLEDLEYVGTKGPPRPTYVMDATKRQYSVYRWEKQIDFAYETLVNDDIGYLEDTVDKMGQAARRTLEKYVSRMYTNATSIGVLTTAGALFSQNGRLTSARISEARMGFNQRVDLCNEPINARLAYIVGHSGLADTALQIQSSELVPELATNAANIVRTNWEWIEDPYITGTAPNLPWYGFTNWRENNVRPFVLARLQGWPGPRVFRRKSDIEAVTSLVGPGTDVSPILGDFETGNVVLKVVDVWGTYIDSNNGNLFDYRGAYYSTGTAP